jgi:hypothetical protein
MTDVHEHSRAFTVRYRYNDWLPAPRIVVSGDASDASDASDCAVRPTLPATPKLFPPFVVRMSDVHRRCAFMDERWTVALIFYHQDKGQADPTVSKQWLMSSQHVVKFLRSALAISTAVAARSHYAWIFPGGSWSIDDVEVLLWPPGTFVFSAIQAYAEYRARLRLRTLPAEADWLSALCTLGGLAGARRGL